MTRRYKVNSIDNFVSELQQIHPEQISIQASVEPRQVFPAFSITRSISTIGRLGIWNHGLLYSVKDEKRTRGYLEGMFTSFQSEHGFADAPHRNLRIISLLLAAETRAELLASSLSDTDVSVAGADAEQPMSAALLEQLHQNAAQYNVTSALITKELS